MKKIFIFSLFLFITGKSFSQHYLIIDDYTVINPSGPGNCDGAIIINSLPSGVTNHVVYYEAYSNGIGQFYSPSDTITGLCEDFYILMVSDQDNRSNFTVIYLETSSGDPFGLAIDSMIINPESSIGACDGNILISSNSNAIGSNVNVTDPLTSTGYWNATISADPEIANGLCMPPLNELNVDYDGLQVIFNNNQFTNCYACIMTHTLSNLQNSNTLSSCDGSVTLQAFGGIPPYSYIVSNGSSNVDSTSAVVVSGLCQGNYTYTITDDAGNIINGNFTILNNNPSTGTNTNLMTISNTVYNPSGPGNCDGSIHVDSTVNGQGPYSYNLFKGSSIYQVSTTPHFYNLCEGQYILFVFDSTCKLYSSFFYLEGSTGNIEAMTIDDLEIVNESSLGMCDGTISFEVNNNVSGIDIVTNDALGTTSQVNSIFNSNPAIINNTCTGNETGYYIAFGNAIDENYTTVIGLDISYYYPYWSTFNSACGGFYAWAETTPSDDTLSCNGTASTVVWGGVPPFTYAYSTGGTNYQEIGICPGYHSVLVTDANGDTTSTTFVVTDTAHLNEMYYWGNPYDTLFTSAIQNCNLDYTLPIDTAILDSVMYESAYDIAVYYTIVQDTNEYYWAETFHIDSTSNYIVSMSFYCENRAFDNVVTILAPLPLADLMMLNVPNPNNSNNELNCTIYPNPVEDILTTSFKLERQDNVEISITDITGKLVSTKSLIASTGNNTVSMNVNGLSNGIYLVNYSVNGQKIQSLKMIKE